MLVLIDTIATSVAQAEIEAPVLGKIEINEVFATRAAIGVQVSGNNAGADVRYKLSLTPKKSLTEVTVLVEGVIPVAKDEEEGRNPIAPVFAEPQHLVSGETYEVLVVAEDGETVEEKREFKTTAPAAPEILDVEVAHGDREGELGAYLANWESRIESNGVETEYSYSYATEAEKLKNEWKPVSGGSGVVTTAEDFAKPEAELKGLEAGATYYLKVTATNGLSKGIPTEKTEKFTTFPAYPGNVSTQIPTKITATSAHVVGGLNPRSAETHWRFEYAMSAGGPWVDGPEGVIAASEADELEHFVEGDLTGLSPERSYFVRLWAENKFGPPQESSSVGFSTAGKPVVTTLSTRAIHGEDMRALGTVEPHGYETHYEFEYVTQAHFEKEGFDNAVVLPENHTGPGEFFGSEGFPTYVVGEDMTGLEPGATYRYRLVASSLAPGDPVIDGGEQTVTMPGSVGQNAEACPNAAYRTGPSAGLPDCRAYEMVTPANKEGSMDNFNYNLDSSTRVLVGEEDGEGEVARVMVKPAFSKWGSDVDSKRNAYFFSRSSDSWGMTSATPQPQSGDSSYQAQLFSSTLLGAAFEVGWSTGVDNGSPDIEFDAGPPGGPYVTVASVPTEKIGEGAGAGTAGWVGASLDFTKLILQVEDHTLLGGPTGTASGYDVYEYAGGQLRQVNVGVGTCGAKLARGIEGYNGQPGGHAVSEDGSRVFFEAVPGKECHEQPHLYERMSGDQTVDVGAYKFLAANANGSTLLLERQVGQVYEIFSYDTVTNSASLLFTTRNFLDLPIVSKELTALYFRVPESLTGEAPPVNGGSEHAGNTPENLYRYDLAHQHLSFIVQTSGAAGSNAGASVSPDGGFYYWAAEGVAGIPGGKVENGSHSVQVYRYDNARGVVECMSCASPYDPEPGLQSTFMPEGIEETANATPNPTVSAANGDYVFFDTAAALVSADVDREISPTEKPLEEEGDTTYSQSSDVYEWRSVGVDGCGRLEGCLALISSGAGGLKNMLLGTTESGRDVFIATHSQLVGQDKDTQGDVYDVRIDGGFPPPVSPPVECEGDACQSPVPAPLDSTPGSLVFSGPGNLVPVKPVAKAKPKSKAKRKVCRKGFAHRGSKCVKSKARAGKVVLRTSSHGHGARK